MKRIVLIVAAVTLLAEAVANAGMTTGVIFGSGGGGAIVNTCASSGTQLDYSDATGCNLVHMMTGRP
jgi:hypothetical protein